MNRSLSMPTFGAVPTSAARPNLRREKPLLPSLGLETQEKSSLAPDTASLGANLAQSREGSTKVSFAKDEALGSSSRAAAPGELDRYFNKEEICHRDGVILSFPKKRSHTAEKDPQNTGDILHSIGDEDSVTSDVTWMTFRAEMMKRAMLVEYKNVKEQQFKKEQMELDRLIKDAFGDVEEDGEKCSQTKPVGKCSMTRTMSTPDFLHQASPNKAKLCKMGKLEETEEDAEEEGKLAQDFGCALDENAKSRGNLQASSCSKQQLQQQDYLDSIIELKMQLAHKQASIDLLSSKCNQIQRHKESSERKNAELCDENANLRQQLNELRHLLKHPTLDRSLSSKTAATTASTLSSSPTPGQGLIRQLSMVNLPTLFQRKASGSEYCQYTTQNAGHSAHGTTRDDGAVHDDSSFDFLGWDQADE